MTSVELLMQRTHDLAMNGAGYVSPNPLVGCVIVNDDEIIGEGWHRSYGGPHAEVNAVESVKDQGQLAGSTVFVNLEPCSHQGKTPPCADMLIRHKVGRVIISNVDPNPLVHGQGITRLKAAGIEVITGVLEREGRLLNRRFFTAIEKQRPYVILKWAQTGNGLVAGGTNDPRWISNSLSRRLVHKWRSEEDAVLVGYRTALADNPQLNVRDWSGRNPIRIVIDRDLTLPSSLHLFDDSLRTIVINGKKNEDNGKTKYLRAGGIDFLRDFLQALHAMNIHSILVEGGSATLKMFLEAGLWDEARVFESKHQFQSGLAAPQVHLQPSETSEIGDDLLMTYQNLNTIPVPVK
jgi:diaminohydroxyphosphoribosylaminopyrimidine deaminase/5-amino-6-(5-phosphoribosylamino)uracil reductase